MQTETGTQDLEKTLSQALEGEVRFDAGYRAMYSSDASNYRQAPIGVVFPKSKNDILKTLEICRRFDVPVLSRGAGTSLAGQCCNVAVILDMSRFYNTILSIDPFARTARVQPGVVLDDLRREAGRYGLTFGPDPASHSRCTLGGMIGNNSCGVHALEFGKTVDNVLSLEIATYDGWTGDISTADAPPPNTDPRWNTIVASLQALRDRYGELIRKRFPQIPRRVSGYNIDELLPEKGFNIARSLVGSEGTCVVVLEATLKLVPDPKYKRLVVLGYPTVFEAADDVPTILAFRPSGLEGMDDDLIKGWDASPLRKPSKEILPLGAGWLLVEFGGNTEEEARRKIDDLIASLAKRDQRPTYKRCETSGEEKAVWAIRESALALTAFVPGQRPRYEGWDDAAVPPEKMGAYLRDYRQLCRQYNYESALYGHFGDGCLHTRVSFDLISPEGLATTRRFLDDAADLVVRYGGSLSGEHGDGQGRAELFPKMFGPDVVKAFEEFKAIWDPTNKMNPGKMVHAYRITDNLRLRQADLDNPLSHSLAHCVGVGACRRDDGGMMCPSYRATRDEKHSTRGRARMLYEMLRGEIIEDGWQSADVHEALDLCLACKACKKECPTGIDMAGYKAEFFSRHYQDRERPLRHYVFGYVHRWLALSSRFAGVANFLSRSPLGTFGKWIIGIHPQRRIPQLAQTTFRDMIANRNSDTRGTAGDAARPVLLWIDTFTNHLEPGIAQAATIVLKKLGFDVLFPTQPICCGRPFYDTGMMEPAKAYLEHVLETLKHPLEAGTPIVMLEPSCASVFKDELIRLFPSNPLARRLKEQTVLFAEFLERSGTLHPISKATPMSSVLIQRHCHEQALMNSGSEERILRKLGYDVRVLSSECCGMAGAFGFEKEKYDVSVAIAERGLLPAIRQASADTVVLADGFSCREQVRQLSDRKPMHLAEFLAQSIE